METTTWTIRVAAGDAAAAASAAAALADRLREIEGVASAERSRTRDETMDLGTLVTVVASSAAATALAQGIAAWLKARRGATLDITTPAGQVKADGLDQETLLRLAKLQLRP